MKKLILKHRGDKGYFLIDENAEEVIASLDPNFQFDLKLSKKNCDEIFGEFDVKKLAEEYCKRFDNLSIARYNAYIEGFKKHAELTSDKEFSAEDVKCVITNFYNNDKLLTETNLNSTVENLRHLNEIEVEIVMQDAEKEELHIWQKPKLDENGCLILKKVK